MVRNYCKSLFIPRGKNIKPFLIYKQVITWYISPIWIIIKCVEIYGFLCIMAVVVGLCD